MKCVVCGQDNHRDLYPDLKIVECQCGHIFYAEPLSKNEIEDIYSEDYFSGEEYAAYQQDKKVHQRNFRTSLDLIKRYVKGGKLLEVGSAYGYFLELAKKDFDVKGFEICVPAAERAQKELGVNVQAGDFIAAEVPAGEYDVACMYGSIEHLASPQDFVQKMNHALKKGGYLFLTTGDIGALVPRIRGKKWRMIHPPSHVHYFSSRSMRNLLTRHGFEVVDIKYPGTWRSFCQLFTTVLKLKKPATFIPGKFWLNTFDIMEVVARKV